MEIRVRRKSLENSVSPLEILAASNPAVLPQMDELKTLQQSFVNYKI